MNLLELIDKLGNHLNRMDQRLAALEDTPSMSSLNAIESRLTDVGKMCNGFDLRLTALERKTNLEGSSAWNRLCDDVENLQSKVEDLDNSEVLLADDFGSNFRAGLDDCGVVCNDTLKDCVRDILSNATIDVDA